MILVVLATPVAAVLIVVLVCLVTGDWDIFDNHPERRGR